MTRWWQLSPVPCFLWECLSSEMWIWAWEGSSRSTNKRQPALDCCFYRSRRKDGREYPSLSRSTPNSSLTREDFIWSINHLIPVGVCVFKAWSVISYKSLISGARYLQCERAVEVEATGCSINQGEGWKCPTHVCLPLGRLPLKASAAPRNRNWQFLNVYSISHFPSEETHQKIFLWAPSNLFFFQYVSYPIGCFWLFLPFFPLTVRIQTEEYKEKEGQHCRVHWLHQSDSAQKEEGQSCKMWRWGLFL